MSVIFRTATHDDVADIVAMLADDMLGKARETAPLHRYLTAFDQIEAEGNSLIIVGELSGQIVACYQLTIISGLSLSAARRALLEGVRVAASHRGQKIGRALMADAELRARGAGCSLMQLTTNKSRIDAHRFYDRLGFTPSHIGYKKTL